MPRFWFQATVTPTNFDRLYWSAIPGIWEGYTDPKALVFPEMLEGMAKDESRRIWFGRANTATAPDGTIVRSDIVDSGSQVFTLRVQDITPPTPQPPPPDASEPLVFTIPVQDDDPNKVYTYEIQPD